MKELTDAILRVWQSFNDWCEKYFGNYNPDQ